MTKAIGHVWPLAARTPVHRKGKKRDAESMFQSQAETRPQKECARFKLGAPCQLGSAATFAEEVYEKIVALLRDHFPEVIAGAVAISEHGVDLDS